MNDASEATHPTEADTREQGKTQRPWRRRASLLLLGLVSVFVALWLLPAGLAFAGYFYFQTEELILPGVRVGGVLVGGMTLEEGAAVLDQTWNQDYLLPAIDSTDPARSWIVMPAEFGLHVDGTASAVRAFAIGRERDLAAGVSRMLTVLKDGWEVEPIVSFDPRKAQETLAAWQPVIEIPARDAILSVEDGWVHSEVGSTGSRLDIGATLELLSTATMAILFEHQFLPLVMYPVEPRISNAENAADELDKLLGSGITLKAYDPVTDDRYAWEPSRQEIASWIKIQRQKSGFVVDIDPNKVIEYLGSINAFLGEERFLIAENALDQTLAALEGEPIERLRIQYYPRDYVVKTSDTLISISFEVGVPYWKIIELNPKLQTRGLERGEVLAIPPRDALLSLPVVPEKRVVISLTQQTMWLYENGESYREHPVSTGISSSPTLPGIFQISAHHLNAYASIWDLQMPHFLSIYDATPGLTNGIHGLPLLSNGRRLWGDVLGRTASYGCIILDLGPAESLYNWAEDGVVVEIQL